MTTVTVSFLLIILALAPEHNARPQNVNISQSGNVRITTINGVIKCDEMICPSNSVGCSVSVETVNNLADVETLRKCYDSNGVTLKEEKSTAPNPIPGTAVSSFSDSSSAGVIQQFHYGNDGNNGVQDISAQIGSLNNQFQEWQQNFQQQMSTFNANIQQQIQDNVRNLAPK